jgi:hypothetical protein
MKRSIAFLFSLFTFFISYAQTGQLEGVVTGSDQREGLVGVNIIMEGTVMGTVSGVHGDYFLSDIPPGSYTVVFSYIGYETYQPFSAASSKAIRNFDLKIKPVRSAQDVLLLVPGLFIAQHAGGGKAEQIFMRVLMRIMGPMWGCMWMVYR